MIKIDLSITKYKTKSNLLNYIIEFKKESNDQCG
jgi:hypothetical protein